MPGPWGEALTLEVRLERGCRVVTAAGPIDASTVSRLRGRLLELTGSSRTLIVDLGGVSSVDSAGLSALVGAARRAAVYGGTLYVVCARPRIRQVLRLAGLDRQVRLARTIDEVLNGQLGRRPGIPIGRAPLFPPRTANSLVGPI